VIFENACAAMWNQSALDAGGRQQRHAEDDVGELADGGVGEPRLEVVLAQRDDGRDEDRDGDEVRGGQPEVERAIVSVPKT
jgi:hypothetical protein